MVDGEGGKSEKCLKWGGWGSGCLPGFLWAKSIVMQISFVMLIFLLFLDHILGQKSLRRGQTALGGTHCPLWKKARGWGHEGIFPKRT